MSINQYEQFARAEKTKLASHLSGNSKYEGDVKTKAKESFAASFPYLLSEAHKLRDGYKDQETGVIRSKEVYLSDILKTAFGMDTKQFMAEVYGIDFSSNSLANIAKAVLGTDLTGAQIATLFKNKTGFANDYLQMTGGAGTHGTSNQNPAFRFLIPEIILEIVNTAYMHNAMYPQWIGQSVTVSNRNKITVPRIDRSDMGPYEIREGQDIPLGSLKFGQKDVKVHEYGRGIAFTDQFLQETILDLVALALDQFGADMNLYEDNRALNVLISGEQSDGSESAPVIGVDTLANEFARIDLDRAMARMALLKSNVNRVVGIDTNGISNIFKNLTDQQYTTVADYFAMKGIAYQNHPLTSDNQILLLDSASCMNRLVMGGMQVEEERNAKNRTNEVYFSFKSGFYINRRDRRLLIDKSVTYASTPFPAYMSADFLKQQFQTFAN